jgi:hypothetical protein
LYDRSDSIQHISPIVHHTIRNVAITANIIFVDFIVIKELVIKNHLLHHYKQMYHL